LHKAKHVQQFAANSSLSPVKKDLHASWQRALEAEFAKPYFHELEAFVDAERKTHVVYPLEDDVFHALRLTPLESIKVVLLGQDPYPGAGQAHGLCFSVRPGIRPPPSLVNIFKELKNDLGYPPAHRGCLEAWAQRGVLLLNAVLTVTAGEPNSHQGRGWEQFTDAVISAVNERSQPAVFLFWGNYARKKGSLVDAKRHRVLASAHPSPLSARKFFGTKPFSAANRALAELGLEPVDWRLDESP
jgi:uracil-DNA glycosylase